MREKNSPFGKIPPTQEKIQPRVEEIVYQGIPITVSTDEQSTSPKISVQGPHKRWNFTIMKLGELVALNHVENISDNQAVRGETTALAAIGMNQLQTYVNRTQRPLLYMFDSENPQMIAWYNNGGKAVLGVDKGFETHTRIMMRREFRPTT
jgi:hypothetical protein